MKTEPTPGARARVNAKMAAPASIGPFSIDGPHVKADVGGGGKESAITVGVYLAVNGRSKRLKLFVWNPQTGRASWRQTTAKQLERLAAVILAGSKLKRTDGSDASKTETER